MLTVATPGVPRSTPRPGGTVEGIRCAHALGLSAMELEWVQRVPLSPERMAEIRSVAEELDFSLTVHAPYYINLHSADPAKRIASIKRIVDALSMAQLAGAQSVCVHAAFYGTDPDGAMESVRRATEEIMQKKNALFPNVNLAYETMGKHSQYGTVEELLTISKEFGIYPCIDVAHLHARSNGAMNTAEEFHTLLDAYAAALGKESLKQIHVHVSGIAYGEKGEKHHLPFAEADFRWRDFLDVLHARSIGGILVCESPLMEEDALLLHQTLSSLHNQASVC